MSTHVDSDTRRLETRTPRTGYRPPYGPVEALLGYLLFYVVVARATPTIVSGTGEVFPGVAPGAVRFALAAFLWFVFVVFTVDQLRRQLAALGIGSHDQVDPDPSTRAPPSEPLTLACLVGLVFGGIFLWATFEAGLAAVVTFVGAMVPVDPEALLAVDALVLVVFFVAFGVVTWSLDRLVVGGLRWALAD